MNPKIATVPKWKPKEPVEIVLMRWKLKRGISDRRERERAEAVLAEFQRLNR